jgi:inorganic pyrophosphatase
LDVPSTLGDHGDTLDVLVLTDHQLPVGSVIVGELVAVLEAMQIEGRQKQRNDRLIATPIEILSRKPMLPEVVLNSKLKRAVSEFFVKYNELQGRVLQPRRYGSASHAVGLVRKHSLGLQIARKHA